MRKIKEGGLMGIFIVGCDADGVLTDLSTHNLREGERVFKRKAINIDEYSIENQFDLSDISKPILYLKAFKIYINYCQNEEPRKMVTNVINELSSSGFNFHSITARKFATDNNCLGYMARKMFSDWLNKNNLKFSSYHFCSEDRSMYDKLLACKKLNVNVMIEDRADVALHLADNGIMVLLFDAPYNKFLQHKNVIRVTSWEDIRLKLIDLKKIYDEQNDFCFEKKDKNEVINMDVFEKKIYFDNYKLHLKSFKINEAAFKKGDRIFKLIYNLLKIPVKLVYNTKVFGKEKIPYQNGFIIASNHIDSTDQYKIGLALGNRPFVGYAAKEIENTIRGRLFKLTGLGIFVDRNNSSDKQNASELMAQYVSNDRIALIFPEGTRKNKTEEGKQRFQNRFKIGTVSLAQKTGTGILPVSINSFGSDVIISFGEIMYVNPEDNLIDANKNLEINIANMGIENIKYYLEKKHNIQLLNEYYKKYLSYIDEISTNEQKNLIKINKDVK